MRPEERDHSAFDVRQKIKRHHNRQRQPQHGMEPQRRLVAVALQNQHQRDNNMADAKIVK